MHLLPQGCCCRAWFPEGKYFHISIWGHNDSPIQIRAVAVTQAFQDPGAKTAAGKEGGIMLAWESTAPQEELGLLLPMGEGKNMFVVQMIHSAPMLSF